MGADAGANKVLVTRILKNAWNKGSFVHLEQMYDANWLLQEDGSALARVGPEGFKTFVGRYRQAFPDLHVRIDDQLTRGDFVITSWTATGTHLGSFADMAPTGRSFRVQGVTKTRFRGGRIVESRYDFNLSDLLHQLASRGELAA